MFGWYCYRRDEYRLSVYPADAPVRPSIGFVNKEDVMRTIAAKRLRVLWHPPLHADKAI